MDYDHKPPVNPPLDKPVGLHNGRSSSTLHLASLSVSSMMMVANLLIIVSFSTVFGWNWFGVSGQLEHWKWGGGLIGMIAFVASCFAIIALFIPYVFMSGNGLVAAIIAFAQNRGRVLAALLIIAHSILLIPPAIIGFWFFADRH